MTALNERLIGKSLDIVIGKGGYRQTEHGVVVRTNDPLLFTSGIRAEQVVMEAAHVVVLPPHTRMEAGRYFAFDNVRNQLNNGEKLSKPINRTRRNPQTK